HLHIRLVDFLIRPAVHKEANPPHALALCPRRQRPRRRRSAEEREEGAAVHGLALHSITSSARRSTMSGTCKTSALAALRLSVNSYFVGFCTGRSAAFSPLRMRST